MVAKDGYAMAMLWLYDGYAMAMLCLCYGYARAMLWLCYGYAMEVLWLYYGCTSVVKGAAHLVPGGKVTLQFRGGHHAAVVFEAYRASGERWAVRYRHPLSAYQARRT